MTYATGWIVKEDAATILIKKESCVERCKIREQEVYKSIIIQIYPILFVVEFFLFKRSTINHRELFHKEVISDIFETFYIEWIDAL